MMDTGTILNVASTVIDIIRLAVKIYNLIW